MKERPILFSTPMVQSILEGRKTVTRRVIKPQPIDNTEIDGNFFEGNHKGYVKVDGHPHWRQQFVDEFCKYTVGDRLWVREAFEVYINNKGGDDYTTLRRVADDTWFDFPTSMRPGRHPSLHFPKEAARLWLGITNIKVERLQDISEEDAIAEGVERIGGGFKSYEIIHGGKHKGEKHPHSVVPNKSAITSYAELWQALHGKESWNANQWVWVIQFKKISNGTKF